MTNQDKSSTDEGMRLLFISGIEMPEAPDYWDLEDFEDILPRGMGK